MKNISRQISYLLRHNPEDLEMDKQGWVWVDSLLKKLGITMQELEQIVETNDKKRFGFDERKEKIRAHQGHSDKLGLKIQFKEIQFPRNYFHGTASSNIESILKKGLKPQSRAYVHLSKDMNTAVLVAHRHSRVVVVFEIDGVQMKRDGLKIYESENGVILTEYVAPKYIKLMK